MVFDNDELAGAIFLFGKKGNLLRQMLYSEFEAILEDYVPAMEWAGQTINAAYVQVSNKLDVVSSVFFLVSFTAKGAIEDSWNIPLLQLAESASEGLTLGKQTIRFASSSHCPINHYQSFLWDPDINKRYGHFAVIKKAVKDNTMVLQFKESENSNDQRPAQDYALALAQQQLHIANEQAINHIREHTAQLLREERLKRTIAKNEHESELKKVKTESIKRVDEYADQLDFLTKALDEEKEKTADLKHTIEGQATKIEGLREYYEHKIAKKEGEGSDDIARLKENYQTEIEAKVALAKSELKSQLNAREVEVMYLNEKNSQLEDEVIRLRKENKEYLANSGDSIINKMVSKGISFVAYHSGVGHLTIPQSDVSQYLDNPQLFAAQKCGVSEVHYLAWLKHYQTPVCAYLDTSDVICGENLDRIENPIEFKVNQDDRCQHHQHNRTKLKLAGS